MSKTGVFVTLGLNSKFLLFQFSKIKLFVSEICFLDVAAVVVVVLVAVAAVVIYRWSICSVTN